MQLIKMLLGLLVKNPGALAAQVITAIAEGKLGAWTKAAYIWMVGKKTWTGIILGAAAVLLGYLCSLTGVTLPFDACAWQKYLVDASLIMASVGLLDGAVRATPPDKK
jgi:hypothetical protein